jgi:DNA-binding NarL/FixJ family response regulator
VLKDASRDEIVAAVAAVAAGGTAFDERLVAEAPDRTGDADHDLTDRELQVLQLLVDGASPRDVADALVVSPKTVGNHLTNIYRKLDVHSRTQAITRAIKDGLVDPPV